MPWEKYIDIRKCQISSGKCWHKWKNIFQTITSVVFIEVIKQVYIEKVFKRVRQSMCHNVKTLTFSESSLLSQGQITAVVLVVHCVIRLNCDTLCSQTVMCHIWPRMSWRLLKYSNRVFTAADFYVLLQQNCNKNSKNQDLKELSQNWATISKTNN